MARAILTVGAIGWSIGCLAAIGVAIVGVERLVALLPPLQVDTEAVRGAVTAVAGGFALAVVAHLVVLTGLRRRQRRAWSAGILLSALLAATFVALAAAAFTSAVVEPAAALPLVMAGLAAAIAGLGYSVAAARLVGDLRSRTPG